MIHVNYKSELSFLAALGFLYSRKFIVLSPAHFNGKIIEYPTLSLLIKLTRTFKFVKYVVLKTAEETGYHSVLYFQRSFFVCKICIYKL